MKFFEKFIAENWISLTALNIGYATGFNQKAAQLENGIRGFFVPGIISDLISILKSGVDCRFLIGIISFSGFASQTDLFIFGKLL